MPDDQVVNPTVSITNNSGVDVEIFDVFDPGSELAKGLYTYTSLGTIKTGQTATVATIHMASQLQALYTGMVAALGNTFYEKFPVAVLAVTPLDDSTLSQTITADDRQGMEQAFLFAKYSSASADSKLTTQFVAALNAEDQQEAVNKFFASTANFRKCTIFSWTTITAWQCQFLSAWQGPYYLYENDPQAKAIKLIAVANIVSSPSNNSAKIYFPDAKGSYSESSQKTDIAPVGDGTIAEKDVGASPITVSLTPAWMNISATDANGNVTYGLGGAMSGSVNGIKVLGTGQKMKLPDPSSSGKGEDTFDRASKIYGMTASTLGMVISMGMLFIMFMQWRGEKKRVSDDVVNKSKDPKTEKDALKSKQKAAVDAIDMEMSNLTGERAKKVIDHVAKLSGISSDLAIASKNMIIEDTYRTQVKNIKNTLKMHAANADVEAATQDLMASQKALKEGRFEESFSKLSRASTTLKNFAEKAGTTIKVAERAAIEEMHKNVEAAREAQETLDRITDRAKENAERPIHEDVSEHGFDLIDHNDFHIEGRM